MSLERTKFPKHNPFIRLKILLIVFLVEQFKNFRLYMAAPLVFFKVGVWTDMSLNRNLAEETHARIDIWGSSGRFKML